MYPFERERARASRGRGRGRERGSLSRFLAGHGAYQHGA